jgi:streptogramin lyase
LIRSAAGYVVSNLVSGGSQTITVEMTPGQRVPGGTTKSATVNVFWDKNAAAVRDAVQAITTCLITRQPDLSIRREIDLNYLGIGVYNSTGADQTRTLEVEVGQTAVYLLQLRNAGNVPNRFVLTGTSSGNGWSVKYYGSKQYLRLDGADDYIDFGNWFNYNTYTIALWLKTGSSQVTYADIMDNNHRGGINWVIQQNEGQVNRFYVGLSDGNPGLPMVNLVANRWQHLAVTRDTNRLNSVYLDGVLLGSAKGAGPINYDGNQFLRLGRWGGGGRNWNGAIDELHIWNRALNAEEISADWANTLTPESSGTMGFWRFDEGTGNVVHDASANGRHGTLVNGPAWVSAFDQLSDRTDISAQITGAGYATMLLGPGAVVEFMVEVTPNASVPGGAAKEVIVTATSMADRTKLDTVKAVTVLAKPSTVAEGGTYTSNADFDKNARMVGVEHTTVPDQLQLTRESFTFPFIWVPNSNEGTVSKVDTRTGRELGRYRTGPQSGANPSRTTVDLKGNCWVGNRQTATAVKIGLLENGQYNDRNGNGIIETSQDLNGDGDITGPELLPWGQDECVLFEVALLPGQEKTYVPGTPGVPYGNDYWNPGTRGFAVDPKDNVWVGTYATKKFYYIDGKTGQILKTIDVGSVNHTSYGATMSTDGIVWSAGSDKRHVLKLNPTDGSFTTININHHVYGIAPDKNNHLFVSGWQETKLSRINMTNNTVEWTVQGIYESRGVAVTDDGDVWVANSGPGTVARWSNNGVLKTTIPVGNQPTGVAVDAAGKVWVVNVGDEYIHRIDPETDSVDLSKRLLGATHYGYSDMTGIIARSATTRIGFWSVIHNAKLINTPWGVVSWHSLEPEGTSIKVRVRSSNDQETWSLWETAYNGEWLHATPPGKYLEVEATLQTFTGDLSPVLYDLTILPASSIDLGKEIYSNDFQEIIGSEWSNPNTDLTPRANRRFLGQFNNQTVSLTLTNLPPHAAVSVLFDLFVIRSWDGNGQETTANFGPDVWGVNVAGGLQLLNTTFNNAPSNNAAAGQAYPEAYPGGLHTPLAGAAETNTLGYVYTNENRIMDSVYRLGYTFPHSADRLALNFFATGLNTNVFEESWGLDNVRVFITPIALPLRLAPLGHSTNGFRLQLQGEPQLTCILQATTNLVSWQDISTNTLVSNKLDLIDTEATKFKRRFYRALQYP